MSFSTNMNKIRHWDNQLSKWLMRHFYFMFFQVVLVIVFLFWFVNMFHVIDTSLDTKNGTLLSRILVTQSINTTIIVLLLLLNSFWMLYIFNTLQRMYTTLKNISYNTRRRWKDKK